VNTKTICSNLNSLNTFTKETGSHKVKLAKVGSNAIVPVEAEPNKELNSIENCKLSLIKLKLEAHFAYN